MEDQNYSSNLNSLTIKISEVILALRLYLNGIENSNVSIVYGNYSNFTAIPPSSNYFVRLYVNGTPATSFVKGKSKFYLILSAGDYKVTAATNSSGISNLTYYEKINKSYPNLVASVPANFTYNGSSVISHFDIISINSQLSGILNLNGKTISSVPQFYLI